MFIVRAVFIARRGCDAPKEENAMKYGLSNQNGTLVFEGAPYFGMGVNFYNLFNSSFPKEEGDAFDVSVAFYGLKVLAENKIPYVRANLGGYYWHELPVYLGRKEEYRAAILKIAKEAERLGVGIIPSFFWLIQCVSDYYREPMRAWGDETSLTRRFMREYTADMTALLKDCQSIWGWEFGNEYNLGADLPNAAGKPPAAIRRQSARRVRLHHFDGYRERVRRVFPRSCAKTIRTIA